MQYCSSLPHFVEKSLGTRFCTPCKMADIFSVFISPCGPNNFEFRKSTELSCSKANLLFYKICWKNPNFLKQMLRTLCHDFPLTNCYDYAMQHNFPSLISADFNERLISLLRLSLKILKLKSINLCQLFCIEDVLTLSQGYFDQRTFWPENVLTGKQMTYHPTSSKFSIHHSHLQAILENHL